MRYLNKTCCKNPACSQVLKSTIYRSYKQPLVRRLCEYGCCKGVTRKVDGTSCRNCNGKGIDLVYRNRCRACFGTGRYSPYGRCDAMLEFTFLVCGFRYVNHLPESQVGFEVVLRDPHPSLADPDLDPPLVATFSQEAAMQAINDFLSAAGLRKAS